MITIKKYSGEKANFYIQSHGLHSGRPLKEPIPNCFAVYNDIENAFEIVFAVYISNAFKKLIKGSVIPFISIKDTRSLIIPVLNNSESIDPAKLKAMNSCDTMIENLKQQIKKYGELQSILAMQVIKGK